MYTENKTYYARNIALLIILLVLLQTIQYSTNSKIKNVQVKVWIDGNKS